MIVHLISYAPNACYEMEPILLVKKNTRIKTRLLFPQVEIIRDGQQSLEPLEAH